MAWKVVDKSNPFKVKVNITVSFSPCALRTERLKRCFSQSHSELRRFIKRISESEIVSALYRNLRLRVKFKPEQKTNQSFIEVKAVNFVSHEFTLCLHLSSASVLTVFSPVIQFWIYACKWHNWNTQVSSFFNDRISLSRLAPSDIRLVSLACNMLFYPLLVSVVSANIRVIITVDGYIFWTV